MATAADAPAIARLERDAIPGPWSEAMVAPELVAGSRLALVDDDGDGRLLAGWALYAVAAPEAELLRLAVAPLRRRRGRGGALLAAGRERLVAAGVRRIDLEVRTDNVEAIALYRREGFDAIGRRRRYYTDGTDALLLSAVVDPSRPLYPDSRTDELER